MLIGLATVVRAQEVVIDTSYYRPPPPVRARTLQADPEKNYGSHLIRGGKRADSRHDLAAQLNEVRTWYIGAEGGFRSDGSVFSNSFDGLISTPTQTKATGGLTFGYGYRNAWILETGVTYAPIHLAISVANRGDALVYTYTNSGYSIPFRIKRRLGSGRLASNGTGFWITGGAWLVPNGSGQLGDFSLIGYSYRGRNRVDTLRLSSTALVSNRITGVAELGLDYAIRLSSYLELGFFGRKYWGLGTALQSNLLYTVNGGAEQRSTLTANGSGWGFGLALRYIYSRQHELKKP